MSVSERTSKVLGRLSSQSGVPVEQLTEEYLALLTEPDISATPETAEENALLSLRNKYVKSKDRSPAVFYWAFFIGATPKRDSLDFMRDKARKEAEKDFDSAVMQGLINRDGAPLDTRTTIGKRDNKNFGHPIPPDRHEWNQTLIGIGSKEGDPNPKEIQLNFYGPLAEDVNYKFYRLCTFRAIEKQVAPKIAILNGSKKTAFKEIGWFGQSPIDMEAMVKNCIWMVPFNEIPTIYEQTKDAKGLRMISTEATVLSINPEQNLQTGSRMIVLADPDVTADPYEENTMTCFVPDFIELNFGEDSKVYVFGRLSKRKPRGELDNFPTINMNAYGIMTLKGYIRKPRPVEKAEEDLHIRWE